MQIIIDTDTITDSDRALLTSLLGAAPTPARAPKPAPRAKEPLDDPAGAVAEASANIVAIAKKLLSPSVAREAGDDPADAVTPAEPELPYDEAPTMADALAAATQAVSKGGSAKVKAALAVVSSKRVSEMKVEDIPAFLAALSAG